MPKVLSGKELDQAAIDAAIARSPFNAHEKSHVAVGRSVMALMYKDGYRASEAAHADYRTLEEQAAYFRKEWNKAEGQVTRLEEELAALRGKVGELVELVEADRAYDVAQSMKESATNGEQCWDAEIALNDASESRRQALEALK
jgi:phage shock protein A